MSDSQGEKTEATAIVLVVRERCAEFISRPGFTASNRLQHFHQRFCAGNRTLIEAMEQNLSSYIAPAVTSLTRGAAGISDGRSLGNRRHGYR